MATGSSDFLDRWGRATDVPLLAASFAFLVVLLVPLYQGPAIPTGERSVLRLLNVVLWVAFGVDYGLRLCLSPDRRVYVRGHVPDLLMLVVPVFRPLRAVRVLGVLGSTTRRVGDVRLTRTLTYVAGAVGVLVAVAGGFVLEAERGAAGANITSAGDALWWASTTVSTVGYGDRFPVTGQGRLVAVGLMIGGIALLGVVTAAVAGWFVQRFSALEETEESMERTLSVQLSDLSDCLSRLETMIEEQLQR